MYPDFTLYTLALQVEERPERFAGKRPQGVIPRKKRRVRKTRSKTSKERTKHRHAALDDSQVVSTAIHVLERYQDAAVRHRTAQPSAQKHGRSPHSAAESSAAPVFHFHSPPPVSENRLLITTRRTGPRTSWLLFRTAHCHFRSVGESPELAIIANLANVDAMEKNLVHTVQNTGRFARTMHPILGADMICSRPLSQETHDKQAPEGSPVGDRMATEIP